MLKRRQPKLKLDDVALVWSNPALLLCPVLWRSPPTVPQIYGEMGTDGTLVEALKKRWRTLLAGVSERSDDTLANHLITLYNLVEGQRVRDIARAPARPSDPEEWAVLYWDVHVVPVTEIIRGKTSESASMFPAACEIASPKKPFSNVLELFLIFLLFSFASCPCKVVKNECRADLSDKHFLGILLKTSTRHNGVHLTSTKSV